MRERLWTQGYIRADADLNHSLSECRMLDDFLQMLHASVQFVPASNPSVVEEAQSKDSLRLSRKICTSKSKIRKLL